MALVWGLVVILIVGAWSLTAVAPPAPVLDETADPSIFSAGRVLQTMRLLDPDETPHPVGSDAHGRVRERLLAQLSGLGLEYEVQRAWSCRPGATCAPVYNVMARLPGPLEGPAIMITAHYDSVHAGPGAGDDLHGVALAIEVARALIADGTPRNPVLLLVTDAEEVGMLGARAFVDGHPWADDVAVVLNVEARGSRGRSSMFETHEGNGPLMASYFDAVEHPAASSLAYEVYRRMPNDTDFTVFKSAGMAGLNFAFIGGVAHYHTPLDDRAHLSLASVQHQGEQVLAVARDLAGRDIGALQGEDAAYLDVAGTFMVHWPIWANLPIALVLLVGWLVAIVVCVRRGITTLRSLGLAVVATIAIFVAGIVVAIAIDWVITRLGGHPTPWYANPLPHRVALWASIAFAAMVTVGGFRRVVDSASLAGAVTGLWIGVGLAAASSVAGATPLFVLPAAAGVGGLLVLAFAGWRRWREPVGLLVPLAVATAVWLPVALAFEEAFGFQIVIAAALPIVMLSLVFAPWACGPTQAMPRAAWLGLTTVVVVAVVVAAFTDPYTEQAPRRLNVLHHTDLDAGRGWIVAGPAEQALPDAMLRAAAFEDEQQAVLPWSKSSSWVAPASVNGAPPPTLEVEAADEVEDGRRITLHLRSARGGSRLLLLVPEDAPIRAVTVEGRRLALEDLPVRWASRRGVLVFGPPADGVRMQLQVGADPLPVELVDFAGDLPADAAAVRDARGLRAVASQWGDGSSIAVQAEI